MIIEIIMMGINKGEIEFAQIYDKSVRRAVDLFEECSSFGEERIFGCCVGELKGMYYVSRLPFVPIERGNGRRDRC